MYIHIPSRTNEQIRKDFMNKVWNAQAVEEKFNVLIENGTKSIIDMETSVVKVINTHAKPKRDARMSS